MKYLLGLVLVFNSLIAQAQPRLIVQIVIDQLRGDQIAMHQQQFGPDGFNWLLQHGVNYSNTHHPHANTSTCSGHASIATGSYPAIHGIIDNEWYDRLTRKVVYCMADDQASVLRNRFTKIPMAGRSPKNMTVSTLSDELVLAQRGRSYAVSFKDRAAISLAGHTGKAFWFDKENAGFVTSTFYYPAYPEWVVTWNAQYQPAAFEWKLSKNRDQYRFATAPKLKRDFGHFGTDFPHQGLTPDQPDFAKYLSMTPQADTLTVDFAIHLLKAEKLGQEKGQTDYLGLSLNATDAIGHQFGPNSLEAEDNLLRLDQSIAVFLKALDQEVGLDHVLIVLTADHGVSDNAAWLNSHHIESIRPINTQALSELIQNKLAAQFNLPAAALQAIALPYIYLDQAIIHKQGLRVDTVSNYLVEILRGFPGIYKPYAMSATDDNKDWIGTKVDKMAYPIRAGELYIVTPPWQSYGKEDGNKVTHGSPWEYDSYVPLIFASKSISPEIVSQRVYTTDIAVTLSQLLGIKAPAGNVGRPLPEVLKYR